MLLLAVKDLFNFDHDKLDELLSTARRPELEASQTRASKQVATLNNAATTNSVSFEYIQVRTPFFIYDSNVDGSGDESRERFLEFISQQGVRDVGAQLEKSSGQRMLGN